MILQDYIFESKYVSFSETDEILTKLPSHSGHHDGFFQFHRVGLILCDLNLESFLKIGERKYNLNEFTFIDYQANGNKRVVTFRGNDDSILARFNYEEFWIDEADLLEFTFELPQDEERDILKFVANKINHLKS